MIILDIGCGNNKFRGNPGDIVIGIDRIKFKNVDIIYDMERFPYPFKDKVFDKVVMSHSLEHVTRHDRKNIKIIEEIYRILKDDGILEVKVPIGIGFYQSPEHKNYVGVWYWTYFSKDSPYSTAKFELIEYEIIKLLRVRIIRPLLNRLYKINPLVIERLINFSGLDAEVKYVLRKCR